MPHTPGDVFGGPDLGSGGPGTPGIRGQRRFISPVVVRYIDLADVVQGYTAWAEVPPGKAVFSASIEITSGKSWTSGTIVEPQWALIPTSADHGFAVTYIPSIQFTSTVQSRPGISCRDRGWVRLITTTATSGDDPAAKVIIAFF